VVLDAQAVRDSPRAPHGAVSHDYTTEESRVPKPNRTTNQYNITATVLDGTIRLSGAIAGDVIEVPKNESGTVVIADTTEWYLYAAENSTNGGAAGCWSRSANAAENTFERVNGDIYNIVYAVAKTNAKSVTYGPVITVKPKG
jgi:hypothetical protein